MNYQAEKSDRPDTGQGMLELFVASPFVVLLILGIVQLGLYINATQAVKTASYRAARSLIVNLNNLTTDEALNRAKEDAALSLINVSPQLSIFRTGGLLFSRGKYPLLAPLTLAGTFAKYKPLVVPAKYIYAKYFTDLKITSPEDLSSIKRGDQIAVRVDYKFDLDVPLAGGIFYQLLRERGKTVNSKSPSIEGLITIDLKQTLISRTSTMQLEN